MILFSPPRQLVGTSPNFATLTDQKRHHRGQQVIIKTIAVHLRAENLLTLAASSERHLTVFSCCFLSRTFLLSLTFDEGQLAVAGSSRCWSCRCWPASTGLFTSATEREEKRQEDRGKVYSSTGAHLLPSLLHTLHSLCLCACLQTLGSQLLWPVEEEGNCLTIFLLPLHFTLPDWSICLTRNTLQLIILVQSSSSSTEEELPKKSSSSSLFFYSTFCFPFFVCFFSLSR